MCLQTELGSNRMAIFFKASCSQMAAMWMFVSTVPEVSWVILAYHGSQLKLKLCLPAQQDSEFILLSWLNAKNEFCQENQQAGMRGAGCEEARREAKKWWWRMSEKVGGRHSKFPQRDKWFLLRRERTQLFCFYIILSLSNSIHDKKKKKEDHLKSQPLNT